MNLPLTPAAETRLEQQRIEYIASLPRKIDCLSLPLEAWLRNPENAAAMAAIMAMVHQLCGSAALHQYQALQKAAEQCRDQLQATTAPTAEMAKTIVAALLDEMRQLVQVKPGH